MDKYKTSTLQICLFVLAIVGGVIGDYSYVLICPNVARPGSDFTIQGTLMKKPSRPVTITAKLNSDGVVASATTTVFGMTEVKLDLRVPAGLNLGDKKTMRLEVRGAGGLTFSKTKTVNFDPKSASVFIQTDKAIYKPGQTVKFRVFGTTPDLKIIYDKMEVDLFDPKGNKIKQWRISGAEITNSNGVYEQEQVMSTHPVLGDWKLKAKLASHGNKFEEHVFEIAEYVLPKFETKLELPSFGRFDLPNFKGTVKATYTYDKPVKGRVNLKIKPLEGGKSTSQSIDLSMPINGETDFTLPTSHLKDLGSTKFVFEVNVTEDLTTARQSDEAELTFYDHPIKLVFPKALPDTFKQKMKYDAVVIISQQDDSPPDSINGRLKVTITEFSRSKPVPITLPPRFPGPIPLIEDPARMMLGGIAKRSTRVERSIMPPWRPRPPETSKVLPPVYYDIPQDGFVTFPIDVTKDLTKMTIKAEYDGQSTTKTVTKRHSLSNTYLQMRLLTTSPTVGKAAKIEVKSTKSPEKFSYQIYSRGSIVQSGTVPMNSKQMVWTPVLTADMAPRAKFVAFYVGPDAEIIADVLMINIDGSVYDNKVDIKFSTPSAAPADNVQLDVKAKARSNVYILGVDKSVQLLASGNDITNQDVLQELQQYDTKTGSSPPPCRWWCMRWPVSVGGEDAKAVFEDAGVLVITDAKVYDYVEQPDIWFARRDFSPVAFDGIAMAARPMADIPVMKVAFAEVTPSISDLAPVKRTRKFFPETWLWEKRQVPLNGSLTIYDKVPDTITSWIASAFAVHPTSGLGVAKQTTELTVSLPFFVTVNLPYSVIRGEKVLIQVNLHNYSPRSHFSMVTFKKSDFFKNIIIENKSEFTTSKDSFSTLTIPPNEIRSLYFPILPHKIGMIDIKLIAQSSMMSDSIHRQLLVEAEGTQKEYNIPILADLKNGETMKKTVEVKYPKRKVPDSEIVRATVIGDLMGPSIKGLDKLLKLPYGCGEQNMLNFAPNIFILKYLKATHIQDDDTVKKATGYMEKGYQRELTYSHSDGSFSAFGERDPSGSTWLTAFVLKSFVQAKLFIFIDDKVIHKAVDWLIAKQQTDGNFPEPGRVIHKAMQGGSVGGQTSRTAYVLISLLEANVVEGIKAKISTAKSKAQSYLESKVPHMTDLYDLAIVSYALKLAGSPVAVAVWNRLDALAKTDAGIKYWEKVANTDDVVAKPWANRNGKAINIELTSYALLTLALRQDRVEGVKVLKWLTEQRNSNGGFSSTQDTVLALQGLAEMATLTYSPLHDVTVTISGYRYYETFRITNTNAQVLQLRDLPSDVGTVTVTASGTGMAFIQIGVMYNVNDDELNRSFDLSVTVLNEQVDFFEVKTCARWLESGSSSMAVLEVGSPSGFVADVGSVFTEPREKKIEMDARKLILYFDEVDSVYETCATVTMQRIGMVAGAQPVPVRIYDYYEPSKQMTKLYVPDALRNSEVCEMCRDRCDVCGAT